MELEPNNIKQFKEKKIWEAPSPEEDNILDPEEQVQETKKKFISRSEKQEQINNYTTISSTKQQR